MAIEKKMTKKVEKKAVVKKAVAVKSVAPKAVVKKAPAKKAEIKTGVTAKTAVSQAKFYAMVSEVAYFSSQNDGNLKGAAEYWVEAEAAVSAKFDVA